MRSSPTCTWIRQLELDVVLTADAAWDMAGDRDVWKAQRLVAGQAVQRVSEWVLIFAFMLFADHFYRL